ncbi:substrate-binding protein [Vibrio sp. IRLE0018]|uniref:substrate-binding protein n=1 Tax=Vibrio TaxID=662 RepID=UPI001594C57C|nr:MULTISPECIES: substrate-binding protein [Vibrio]MCF8779229.1 substrate-binding protein [Vibrio floridensis]NVC63114.1 branched-chain amino acid ABC transporter substrate-binding protein [Vibrio sp. 05-20-BW147]
MSKIRFYLLPWILLSLLSCSEPQPPVKIGAVLPLTGTFSVYGEQAVKGAQLAVEQINAKGGVLGRPLELVIRDNATDPAKTVKYSRELILNEDVFALLGPVSSSSRYAMSEIATELRTPMFYGIDYEGRHYTPYLICYSTIPEHYIAPIVPYLANNVGNSFYIFGYDYIWPHRMSQRIVEEVEKVNGEISGIEFTAFGVKDYTPVLQHIKTSGAKVLMLILPGSDGFNFLKQMKAFEFGREIQVVAFAADETYLSNVDRDALQGVMTALHFFSSLDSNVAREFVQDYQRFHGSDAVVTYSSKAHYDLIYLIKEALEKSGRVDREQLLIHLPGTTLYSGGDAVRLREDHHFDLPMYLAQFQTDRLKVVEKLGIIKPEDQRSPKNE